MSDPPVVGGIVAGTRDAPTLSRGKRGNVERAGRDRIDTEMASRRSLLTTERRPLPHLRTALLLAALAGTTALVMYVAAHETGHRVVREEAAQIRPQLNLYAGALEGLIEQYARSPQCWPSTGAAHGARRQTGCRTSGAAQPQAGARQWRGDDLDVDAARQHWTRYRGEQLAAARKQCRTRLQLPPVLPPAGRSR